ncbi:helix-turn-helix domain-containing protein [Tardiphaga sp. vice352]|uniref:helix-turn-helix domain-containing protein n=1 Tax=unclassified Tardiphaga TaxID=2631404 RepID=UPI0011624AD5|nr:MULTISPECIES: helix-turn-helix domain-containing protein [unclassified Tardiphaga]QDM14596.1 helix-turn-helix domain-containing protein [Tardiphaga sp. vice278]QDM29984.1 helix-turn-helix domain-containing protein [Tardiphaga sp. vice352]
MSDSEIIGTKMIAHKLQVSTRTALRIIKKGELKVFKYGQNSSKNRCSQREIDEYKRNRSK